MAVPAYTHDLVDWIADTDVTAWGELTNAIAGGAPDEADTESALQGTNTVSQSTNTTSLCSMCRILGASVTLATNDVFLVWHGHGVATSLLSYASGGLRLTVASTLGDWKAWAVGGNDVPPFPYGKWVNNPVDPTITGEYTNGTPPAALTFFGVGSMCILSAAVAKGQPHVTDIIRYGRAQSRFTGGQSANYCVFSGFATLNDASSARWGLISTTSGGYLWKGLMKIGLSTVTTTNRARTSNVATLTTSGAHGFKVGDALTITGVGGVSYNTTALVASVPTTTTFTYANVAANEGSTADTGGSINGIADFRDSNTTIFIQDTRKVYATFNKIEIRNASTNVAWSGINFVNPAPSTNASDGDLEVVDNATVVLTACTFTDMATFIFLGNSDAISCQFLRCGQITSSGGVFDNTSILASTVAADASAFVWTDTTETDGNLDDMTFSKGTNAHHAISFASTTTGVDYTLRNIDFSGFNATPASNDSAIYVAATTGTITIYLVGCSGNITAKSAGATVTFISDPVTVTVTTQDINGDPVGTVNVFLKATSGGSGILPVSATVNTITRSGTTATATHAAVHNMLTGDKVFIEGANQDVYNGVFTVTVTSTTVYTYTIASDPGTNATGTLTATFVFLKDTTNAGTGILSMSRVISANQNVTGWARKSTDPGELYRNAPLSGTVSSSADTAFTAIMIADE